VCRKEKTSPLSDLRENISLIIFLSFMCRAKRWDLLSYLYIWIHMTAYGQVDMQLSKNRCHMNLPAIPDHVE
jgi:hypothetical protein